MKKTINRILKTYKLNKNVINKTLLERNDRLSKKYNCQVYLKREDLQEGRSFKFRGAYNKAKKLSPNEKQRGVVCASAGNHAQGVAYSCNKLGIKADIFVPENTPLQKIDSIKKFANDETSLHIIGANFNQCLERSLDFSKKYNSMYIHPFGDQDVIDGQATIGVEIYEDIEPDLILGCIGGGGLMSGISLYSKNINENCKLIGVESKDCNAMQQSIEKGEIIELENYDTFVDGAAVKKVSDLTYNICKEYLDDIVLVSNGRLCNTMLELYQNDGIITEPAGALSVSALDLLNPDEIIGKNIVAVVSGGNNDITRYPEINDSALRYLNLQHYFVIQFGQRPGELKKFVNNILGTNDDITRFEYIKKTNKSYGQVLIGIQLSDPNDLSVLIAKLKVHNFNYIYINDNDLLMSYLV